MVSSGTPARSLDLRLPLFLTMCSCALWGCQTLLRNWIVIKVVFGCMTKHGIDVSRSRCNFSLLDNRRDISWPLEVVGFESALPCQYD
jgi:hypothetical protein